MLNYFSSRSSIMFVSEAVICDFAIDFSEHWLLKINLIPIPFFHLPANQQCDALTRIKYSMRAIYICDPQAHTNRTQILYGAYYSA